MHWPIIVSACLLAVFGLIAIYSASFRMNGDYAAKQGMWFVVSIVLFFVTVSIGYRPFLNVSLLFYTVTLGFLVWVLLFSETQFGANRWINIGRFAIQPSEFAKLATLLTLAQYLSGQLTFAKQTKSVLIALGLIVLPFLLILKQPDLGSALVFIPIFVSIIFLWGLRKRYFLGMLGAGLCSLPVLWNFLKPYQQRRLLVFLDPAHDPIGASYTAIQSKIAVGSGFLWGKGWLAGTQTQLDFVPEHHTDFIFSVIGEEMGFVGTMSLIALFGILIWYMFDILNHTTELRARLLSVGIVSMFFFQVFVNIGMTIGLAPITGITLPFVSYGGSSLAMGFMCLGLLVSIYKERSIF